LKLKVEVVAVRTRGNHGPQQHNAEPRDGAPGISTRTTNPSFPALFFFSFLIKK
jgi:hypothetical protein